MTWKEISRENLDSARSLYSSELWRSAISRAYYSVFSAVTSRLPAKAIPANRTSPAHRELIRLIDKYFVWLQWHQREALKTAVTRTYSARLLADYQPRDFVNKSVAKRSIQDALGVLRRLGVQDGE